jgi:SAM-dependent methyltransferase
MPVNLEEVACNLCNLKDAHVVGYELIPKELQPIFLTDKFQVVQCNICDLIYTSPRPNTDGLKKLYAVSHSEINVNTNMKSSKEKLAYCTGGSYITYDRNFTIKLLNHIEKLIGKKGRILDVGCGEGQIIRLAKENGWEVVGQEFSNDAVKFVRETYGLEVLEGDLRDINLPDEYFDAVVMLNVIEHLTDPLGYLIEIKRILKKGGLLYIGTPNVYHSKVLWPYIPEHIYHFSNPTLKNILNKAGFGVVTITTRNKHDAMIYFEVFCDYCTKKRNVSNKKELAEKSIYYLYKVFRAGCGLGIFKGGASLNGGDRITVFSRKC